MEITRNWQLWVWLGTIPIAALAGEPIWVALLCIVSIISMVGAFKRVERHYPPLDGSTISQDLERIKSAPLRGLYLFAVAMAFIFIITSFVGWMFIAEKTVEDFRLFGPDVTSQPWFIAPAICLGIGLYWFRCRAQLLYGIFELVFASTAIWMAIVSSGDFYPRMIALAGAVYVFVRGMDNVDRGLPPKWRSWWMSFFYGTGTASPADPSTLTAPAAPAGANSAKP